MLVNGAEKPKRPWCILFLSALLTILFYYLSFICLLGLGPKFPFLSPAVLLALTQLSSGWFLLFLFFCSSPFCFMLYFSFVPVLVAAGFAPWRVRPHMPDSTSDQVLKSYLSLTEKKRQHCAYDETKPHKTCLFSFFNPLKVTGGREIKSTFRMSQWGGLGGGELVTPLWSETGIIPCVFPPRDDTAIPLYFILIGSNR